MSPLASGVLLLLFVHAFLVSATHGYRSASVLPAGVGVEAGDDLRRASELGGHAQCLLCRLQRSFVADLQKTSQLVAPTPRKTLACELSPARSTHTRPFSVPAGRAPPLAPIV